MPGAIPRICGWLRRFRWASELLRLLSPRPNAPRRGARGPGPRGCEPAIADAALFRRARRVIAGKRRARKVWNPPFPSCGSQSHWPMPPLFPSWSFLHGSEAVAGGSSSEESDAEIQGGEECLFSDDTERAVYQEYLQSIGRDYGEEDLTDGVMSVSLFKYQRMALAWMIFRENSSHCAGGILADEQGLGKTIVLIALILKGIDHQSKFMPANSDRAAFTVGKMGEPVKKLGTTTSFSEIFHPEAKGRIANAKLFVEDRNPSSPSTLSSKAKPAGGTLVVCPSGILTQWDEEIRRVAKNFGLSVFVYHGRSRILDPEELAKHNVVLTSYGMVKQQFGSRKKGIAKEPSGTDDLNSGPIAQVKWSRIVLDEAHVIRNLSSQVARACWKLEAERRWCMTGTPIQNGIDDLYSYLRFLRYEPYSKYSSFCSLLKSHNSTDTSPSRNKLEIFLGIILMRHSKETLINGEPIIKLPPKTVQTREIFFTTLEHEFYSSLFEDCRQMWIAYDATRELRKSEGVDSMEILSLLKDLQQACNHPCLLKKRDHQQCCTIFERSYVSSKIKATMDILNSITNKVAIIGSGRTTESGSSESAAEKVLVFSQFTRMLDLLEPVLNSRHMQFRRLDGKMTRKARDKAVKAFNMNPKVTVLLVSLMAGNVGLNLTAASHVIIVDPWWNPFVEEQAIGRVHRIGQTRPVTVHRLAVHGTIEERVLYLQDKKRRMVGRAFGGDILGEPATDKLTEEDIRYLFNV